MATRGRLPFLERDTRGWRIPRPGTRSRAIYDLLVGGKNAVQIHEVLGGSLNGIKVLSWKMRNPDDHNRKNRAMRQHKILKGVLVP